MYVKVFIASLLTCISLNSVCQQDSTALNSIYIEAGGCGGYGSLNYERLVFHKKNFGVNVRLGISSTRIRDFQEKINPDFVIPIAVNLTYGNSHKFEIGVGNSFSNVVKASEDLSPVRETGMHGNFHIGYRYQKPVKGFFFRCGYTPIWESFSKYKHWGSLSFGFTF